MKAEKVIAEVHKVWIDKAVENIEEWGRQSWLEYIAAITEEVGELSKAILEWKFEGGDPRRIQRELDDLMALGIQLEIKIMEYDFSEDFHEEMGGGEQDK